MSRNRKRTHTTCLCGHKRPQVYGMFCETCIQERPEDCRAIMNMAAYAHQHEVRNVGQNLGKAEVGS